MPHPRRYGRHFADFANVAREIVNGMNAGSRVFAPFRAAWYHAAVPHAEGSDCWKMSENEQNNLFYVCSLIEFVGRKTKNRRGNVVAAMDDACLGHQLEYADVNHSLPFERVSDELISECGIKEGTFDTITGCRYSIPTVTSIGRVYSTLIEETDEGDVGQSLRKVFGSFISDEISDFANGVYYQNPSYLLESFKAGRLLR